MKPLKAAELKDFLEEKYILYNNSQFIDTDPVSIPHLFSKKEDIEIAGFFAATIAWGQRNTIVRNARRLMQLMDDDPHRFILDFSKNDLKTFSTFVHRTFQEEDCRFYLLSLQEIYRKQGGLSKIFEPSQSESPIINARAAFLKHPHLKRSEKHFSNPGAGSAAKRLNMFLRWMVRKDSNGVDFGIWKHLSPAQLICPLDVHSGRVARKLGLLKRRQNDWQAASDLTSSLKLFDAHDPVKYDFALFGLGVFERF